MHSPQKQPEWKLREIDEELLTPRLVFAQVGATLAGLHGLEKKFKRCVVMLQLVSPKDDDVDAILWRMERPTCGFLIKQLRCTIEIEPGFDRILTRLLRRRNALAHKLFNHTPFRTSAGKTWLRNVSRFCWALYSDASAVEDVFIDFLKGTVSESETEPKEFSENRVANPFLRFRK